MTVCAYSIQCHISSYQLQHTERTFHDIDGSVTHRDSHVFINTYDYLELKPISDVTPAFRDAKECDCEGLYCTEPFYIPVRDKLR